ncbi:uncharacterized protein (TIGR02270 family) [Variovorax boronicumulans]|uniref:TIGR02270 family protein n=1 Tax=Variovorax boronicumulans TaxID=436515 RepID=UPI00278410AC|nr:TIGR02270 family protein [Variovorax boronicumulans]MDP9994087.1 uncharacterized protein (TIGR02270 family) [Variovorax boronicumulans]MDQ0007311.1 uncharacterized protein (TIGR02270 family) [Variovorax boronicumulans]
MSVPEHPAAVVRPRRTPVPLVVQQHVDEAVQLRRVRSVLVRAAHVRLPRLARLDERIAAHLDGIGVAGVLGAALCLQVLERPGVAEFFAVTVRAIEDRDTERLSRLLAAAAALPDGRAGLLSAFGWVEAAALRGLVQPLLDAHDPWWREVGLVACDQHGVDPGDTLADALTDDDAGLRQRALRMVGRRGRMDLRSACIAAMRDANASCAFEAARAALLTGDRGASMAVLEAMAAGGGLRAQEALSIVLKVAPLERGLAMLAGFAKDRAHARTLVRGAGELGDPHGIAWLIEQMRDPKLARLAGESFSLVTGLDLAFLDLECDGPDGLVTGPDDDPDNPDVAMDEDDSLPWPDPGKIGAWWQVNGHRFPAGQRFFMGEPPGEGHCLRVLREGSQRQRAAASLHLSLMKPGTPLFPTAAPAWRQQRWLDGMGA